MFRGVAHGADLHFGRSGGDAYHHAHRGAEPAALLARFLDESANHHFGRPEVGYDAFAQRAYGADPFGLASLHHLSFLAHGDHLAGRHFNGYDRRLVDHNLVVVDDDGIGRAEVDGYFFSE